MLFVGKALLNPKSFQMEPQAAFCRFRICESNAPRVCTRSAQVRAGPL